MHLLNKLRIGALVLATLLLITGTRSTVHPKFKVVAHPEKAKTGPTEFSTVEVSISTSSRVFGVARIVAGGTLTAWVLWTFWAYRPRRAEEPLNTEDALAKPGNSPQINL